MKEEKKERERAILTLSHILFETGLECFFYVKTS